MEALLTRIVERVLLCDGAMGTALQQRGLKTGECPELWNVERSNEVAAIHRDYIQAGAEAVITNTFGGSPMKLDKFGLADQVYKLNRAAAELARDQACDDVYVFGDVGPTGEFLQPLGLLAPDDLVEAFASQIQGLVDGGVDAIIVETMSAIDEAQCGIKAAKAVAPQLPVIASMTYEGGQRGYRTVMGSDVRACAEALIDTGADVVGTNCGTDIDGIIEVVGEYRSVTDAPLIVEPNAGVPELVDGRTVFKYTPEQMAERVPELVEKGANIVGGCCGTTPDHIHVMAEALAKLC